MKTLNIFDFLSYLNTVTQNITKYIFDRNSVKLWISSRKMQIISMRRVAKTNKNIRNLRCRVKMTCGNKKICAKRNYNCFCFPEFRCTHFSRRTIFRDNFKLIAGQHIDHQFSCALLRYRCDFERENGVRIARINTKLYPNPS